MIAINNITVVVFRGAVLVDISKLSTLKMILSQAWMGGGISYPQNVGKSLSP